ncbi:MAG: hypothetical protein ABIA93_01505 [Candidatus Woesearchaeota archaeon]
MKTPKTREDYVEYYSEILARDNKGFAQHRMIINSQIKSSREVFSNKFNGKDFKEQARRYLRELQEKQG